MQRRALMKKIAKAAGDRGLDWAFVRAGGRHDIYQLGTSVRVSIPRHGEINEMTAEAIFKAAGEELGKEWWR